MPSCICGRYYQSTGYKMNPKESVELCPTCLQASTPKTYVNKEWVQGCVVDNSDSASSHIPMEN